MIGAMRVFMTPSLSQADPSNGIGRIIQAQYRYLPDYGVQFVNEPRGADLIHVHAGTQQTDQISILSCHGLYWTGDKGSGKYLTWHHAANQKIMDSARKARLITVPSRWVGECFRRDFRIDPIVIGHGIDFAEWEPGNPGNYVLWNKARAGDVCDPAPAYELARLGVPVWTTFAPAGYPVLDNLHLLGPMPFEEMKTYIRNAGIYLATTQETFGIGTLEAMACAVPVLGFDFGGTAEIVRHKETGYLVKPGDYTALYTGFQWLKEHRVEIGDNCREAAKAYDWPLMIGKYAVAYEQCLEPEPTGLAVVIPCHNYAQYVGEAIESCLKQTEKPDEIIVVDDGSTDNSPEIINQYAGQVHAIYQHNQGVAAARNQGIAATRQPFIICLDADDRLDPRYVQTVKAALIADRGLGIAYTGLNLLHPDGQLTPCDFPPEFSWESQSYPHNPPSNNIHCAAAFRRSMWERAGGLQQIWAPGEDAEFWTRGLSVCFTARRVTNEQLFEYRIHGDSASRTKHYKPIDAWLPWMRDKAYPMGAPAKSAPLVRSYSRPVVSVIIPVGPGHAQYLPAAIDSVLGQTVRDWEVIVVNDTGAELGQVMKPYPFARVLSTGGSGKSGASFARNLGIDAARAPFVLFLDADDYLLPDFLGKTLDLARSGKYVYTDFIALHEDGSTLVLRGADYDRLQMLETQQAHAVTALVPTAWAKDVGGFDPTLPGWEEYDFWMKLAVKGYCGVRCPEPLLGYRVYSGERRKISQAKADELYKLFRGRYPLEVNMSGCCGGNADAILSAKRIIEMGEQSYYQNLISSPPQGEMVRVEFIGDWTGPVMFHANGREYYGARSPLYQFQDMPREDAEKLVLNGMFRIVSVPAKVEPAAPPTQPLEEIRPTVMAIEKPVVEKTAVVADPVRPVVEIVSDEAQPVKATPKSTRRRHK